MGEAKRRAAAQPEPFSVEGLQEVMAKLPPMPMKGAVALDLSPGDYGRVLQAMHASCRYIGPDGPTLDGIAICASPLLIDGLMIGRDRSGKPVWSNAPWMQEAIDANFAPWYPAAPPARGAGS